MRRKEETQKSHTNNLVNWAHSARSPTPRYVCVTNIKIDHNEKEAINQCVYNLSIDVIGWHVALSLEMPWMLLKLYADKAWTRASYTKPGVDNTILAVFYRECANYQLNVPIGTGTKCQQCLIEMNRSNVTSNKQNCPNVQMFESSGQFLNVCFLVNRYDWKLSEKFGSSSIQTNRSSVDTFNLGIQKTVPQSSHIQNKKCLLCFFGMHVIVLCGYQLRQYVHHEHGQTEWFSSADAFLPKFSMTHHPMWISKPKWIHYLFNDD